MARLGRRVDGHEPRRRLLVDDEVRDDSRAQGGEQANVLVDRFLADPDFAALYAQAKVDLQSELIASGTAQGILDDWVAVLKAQASDLVPAATVDSEAAALEEYLG